MRRYLIPALFAAVAVVAPRAAAADPDHWGPKTTDTTTKETDYHWSYTSEHGRLGISLVGIGGELRQHFGANADRGVLISHVEKGSVADKAGLEVGDVLVAVDDKNAGNAVDVLNAIATAPKGTTVNIRVVRDGKPLTFAAKLAGDPASETATPEGMPRFRELMKQMQHELDELDRSAGDPWS